MGEPTCFKCSHWDWAFTGAQGIGACCRPNNNPTGSYPMWGHESCDQFQPITVDPDTGLARVEQVPGQMDLFGGEG